MEYEETLLLFWFVTKAYSGAAVTFIHAIAGHDARLDHSAITRIGLDFPDVWTLPAAKAAVAGIWNRAAARKLAFHLAALPRDGQTLLHLHQWTRALSPSVFKPLLACGLPLAVTAHDYFLACPNGVYYRFEQQKPCALKPLSLGCLTARCDPKSFAHKTIRVARSFGLRRHSNALSGTSSARPLVRFLPNHLSNSRS